MHPPRWLDQLLEWYCDAEIIEDLQGDLYELYDEKLKGASATKAKWFYFFWVLRSFRWSASKWALSNQKHKNRYLMDPIQNLKVSWRVLKRDYFNSIINLLGMTVGITCFILLGLFAKQEWSYDEFHSKKDRIYRSWLLEDYGEGQIFFNSTTPFLFEDIFENDFPEVETAVQFTMRSYPVGSEDKLFNETVGIVSPEFFQVFDFSIIEGEENEPLSTKDKVVISTAFAAKYFGSKDPIGETVNIQIDQNLRRFTVSAVMQDIPLTSSIQFGLAISNLNNADIFGERALNGWFTVAPETYILIKEGNDIEQVRAKSQDVVMSYLSEEMLRDEYTIGFQPLTDIHLNPEIPIGNSAVMNPKYVNVLAIIGLLVLIIACINYTTLTIGQSIKRGVEVGMRKVLGAKRGVLITQYLTESLVLSFIAMLVGSATALLLVPVFNQMTGSNLIYSFQVYHLFIAVAVSLVIGVLAGFYPVLLLSSGKSFALIHGQQRKATNQWVRKSLMVFQITTAVFLITSALIMTQQLNYMANKPLGYKKEGTIYVPLTPGNEASNLPERIESARANGILYKDQLKQIPSIQSITQSTHIFGSNGWANLAFTDKDDVFRRFRVVGVDAEFTDAFEIELKSGRTFLEGNGLDQRQSILVNESAVAYFGWDEPIGKSLPGNNFGPHQIIGVVKDFHYASLHHKVEPLVLTQNLNPIFQGISDGDIMDSMIPKMLIKYQTEDFSLLKRTLEDAWKTNFPEVAFELYFLEDRLNDQYATESQMKELVKVAMVIALIISALGLLGLTVLIINSRQKELGIRKVLGAGVSQIFLLIAKTFSLQLILGVLISVPITIYLMNDWLDSFSYRIGLDAQVFILSGLVIIFVSSLVISFHTLKAARVNPANSLRTE